jgi:HAD superfamily hydrolase (TIGR01509 family)
MHPHVEEFLHGLRETGKIVALVTNAHPGTLAFKLERIPLADYFSHLVSSHEFGYPKESQLFWEALQQRLPFERERTLFIDDSESVLRSAREYGIGHLVAISHPDSQQPGKALDDFISISNFSELHKPA